MAVRKLVKEENIYKARGFGDVFLKNLENEGRLLDDDLKNLADLKRALFDLRCAFSDLNDCWNRHFDNQVLDDFINGSGQDSLADGYPFDKSFNELTQEVRSWANKYFYFIREILDSHGFKK